MKTVDMVFSERTCYKFQSRAIEEDLLKEIYDVVKLGPTSANSSPLRILFLKSPSEREKLYPCLFPSNIDKVRSASIPVIFAYDTKFYDHLNILFPHNLELKRVFSSCEELSLETAIRNSTLQAAYFIIVARSRGIDCRPMSGFNSEAINNTFFIDSSYKVNFLCNLGYKDKDDSRPRLARLKFDECCRIL